MKPDYPIKPFKNIQAWADWLTKHHTDTDGIWIRIYKKATGLETIDHLEALKVALCFGWIDGQRKGYYESSFLQKFTPRRKKSLWSKRNIEFVTKLIEDGLMQPAGQAEIDLAKADGRWDAAYDKPSEMVMPAEFLAELHKNPEAEAFFGTLNKTNTYAIAWRLQTAKTEATRLRRQAKLLEMLANKQKLY